ncbi:hypothetical protein [Hoeflea sp. 108]|uniref:hypothetical protein n=1 Tax=Hoeflea sp. 108 TaxID=1116369 RepID=UPI0031B62DA7
MGPNVCFNLRALAGEAAARDFVSDAFSHCKFIAFTPDATALLEKAGIDPEADEGLVELADANAAKGFVELCRKLRQWSRETAVKL